MRTQTFMFFENLCIHVSVLLLLVVSRGSGVGDNTILKLVRCRDNERRALLDFKADVVDEYGILSSWDKSKEEDCCNWRGIYCSNATGHVTVLNIPGHDEFVADDWTGLRGKVSPSLIELKHLKYLDLSHNRFEEWPIPGFVGSLSRLQHLNLSSAHFTGKIPHQQLGNLTNLLSLDLGFNPGLTVENLEWLSRLHFLTRLDLSGINLEKCIDWLHQINKLSSLTQLVLSSCNLPITNSPLNKSSSSLTSLAVLDLSYNYFVFPSSYNWLFNFSSSLVHIDMSGNSFPSASIPEDFGSLVSLETLRLLECRLQGMLPESFRNLTRLDTLDLALNNFNGKLSEFLRPLIANERNSLGVLRLGTNQLEGSMPNFTRFPSLREISIPENKLSGSFPEDFGQVSGLVRLDLYNNQITGSFPNLTLFSSLEELILFNNKLEDTVPEAYLSNLSNLKYLDLSFNSLSLKFSFDWVPPFQLDFILLQNCTLGPRFPNWIQSQRNFSVLDISSARISDTIPLWFWDISPRLRYLCTANNDIHGMLPDLSQFLFADFVSIDLRSNNLVGPIPSLPVNVGFLDLSQNMFTASLFFLCSTSYKFFLILDLSDNKFSGNLPDCLMNVHQLEILNLANNNFSGKIPTSVGLLNHLQILQLRNNSFTGELPSSLMNTSNMLLLDLSENKLSGEVPTWIGTHLTSLIVLSLHKNEFFGTVPPQICHLRDAQVVDLSQNNLSGSLPNCINNLTSLVERENPDGRIDALTEMSIGGFSGNTKYVANAVVQWKGVASEYRNTLGLLKLIDLSNNRLVSEIPQEFDSLEGLMSLNLSSNNLTGNIIPKISQMRSLEILDLSRNQLTGEIPTGLASLNFLSVLDLSKNSLTGRIPSSTQLQSFNASVYAGNEELCGLPLPNKCGDPPPPIGHDKDENNEEDDDDDDDKLAKIGLYVSVVLGFGTGFWGLLGPILIRSTWRHVYYRLLDKITDWIYVTTTVNMARLQRKFYC